MGTFWERVASILGDRPPTEGGSPKEVPPPTFVDVFSSLLSVSSHNNFQPRASLSSDHTFV